MRKSILALYPEMATKCWSNDGAVTGTGGSMEYFGEKHPTICKVKESVCIDIYPEEYRVREHFIFTNTGNSTITMMRFPENGGEVNADPTYFRSHSVYAEYFETIDGHVAPAKRVVLKQPHSEDYAAYRVRTVPFALGQTHDIRIEYRARPTCMSMGGYGIEYAFTGENWQGSVEQSTLDINFHLAGLSTSYSAIYPGEFAPVGQLATRTHMSYIWENWSATGKFYLSYYAAVPRGIAPAKNQQAPSLSTPLAHAGATITHFGDSFRHVMQRIFAS